MAHLATLLMVPVDALSRAHTRESLASCVAHSSHCSHFIAAHPQIRPILEEGTPLRSEMWHPVAKPHYRLPSDLPRVVATLRQVESSDQRISADAWTLSEIRRLREACEYAIDHELAVVVYFSNTLSRPPVDASAAQREPPA